MTSRRRILTLAGCAGALCAVAAFVMPTRTSGQTAPAPLFQTSDRCISCHNGLVTPVGEDVSIGSDWRSSIMANSARDPYWQASVRRETMDHPAAAAAIEDECSKCHMPMSRYEARRAGGAGHVFANLAAPGSAPAPQGALDGVSCSLCHQISPANLGTRESLVGGFVVDANPRPGGRPAYGPFAVDNGRASLMFSTAGLRPTEGQHIRQSALCATCHTLYTHALGPKGEVIGELAEQVPYEEWLHSEYRDNRSCQGCHMPRVEGEAPISAVMGLPREGVSRHTFPGGNFFMELLLNRHRDEIGAPAPLQESSAAARRTLRFLQSQSATLSIDSMDVRSGRLETVISVRNLTGHKLPTAYPSRRTWLHVIVRDRNHRVVFESGALKSDGSIEGNENDADPARFEPHYSVLERPGEVQIYESIIGDSAGTPTTGLLKGVRYLKDNRVLPSGFDKKTAPKSVAVAGAAADDADFGGGEDKVRYSIPVTEEQGPFQLETRLMYQPISHRWAANMRSYRAAEPERFVGYYNSMAPASAVMLARASR